MGVGRLKNKAMQELLRYIEANFRTMHLKIGKVGEHASYTKKERRVRIKKKGGGGQRAG